MKYEPLENPPAFPATCNPEWCHQEGMTLLDYFAGIALGALLPQSNARCINDLGWGQRAYQVAEEMLKAREDAFENIRKDYAS